MKETALIFNLREWRGMGWFTEEELNKTEASGLIGKKYGVDCYLARPVHAYNYPRNDNDIVCGDFGCKEVGRDNKIK